MCVRSCTDAYHCLCLNSRLPTKEDTVQKLPHTSPCLPLKSLPNIKPPPLQERKEAQKGSHYKKRVRVQKSLMCHNKQISRMLKYVIPIASHFHHITGNSDCIFQSQVKQFIDYLNLNSEVETETISVRGRLCLAIRQFPSLFLMLKSISALLRKQTEVATFIFKVATFHLK